MITPERMEKLPRWARNEINRLHQDMIYHKDRADLADAGRSDTHIRQYGEDDRYLPSGTEVIFDGDDGPIGVSVRSYGKLDTFSRVEVTAAFGGRLTLELNSSNVVIVKNEGL